MAVVKCGAVRCVEPGEVKFEVQYNPTPAVDIAMADFCGRNSRRLKDEVRRRLNAVTPQDGRETERLRNLATAYALVAEDLLPTTRPQAAEPDELYEDGGTLKARAAVQQVAVPPCLNGAREWKALFQHRVDEFKRVPPENRAAVRSMIRDALETVFNQLGDARVDQYAPVPFKDTAAVLYQCGLIADINHDCRFTVNLPVAFFGDTRRIWHLPPTPLVWELRSTLTAILSLAREREPHAINAGDAVYGKSPVQSAREAMTAQQFREMVGRAKPVPQGLDKVREMRCSLLREKSFLIAFYPPDARVTHDSLQSLIEGARLQFQAASGDCGAQIELALPAGPWPKRWFSVSPRRSREDVVAVIDKLIADVVPFLPIAERVNPEPISDKQPPGLTPLNATPEQIQAACDKLAAVPVGGTFRINGGQDLPFNATPEQIQAAVDGGPSTAIKIIDPDLFQDSEPPAEPTEGDRMADFFAARTKLEG